MRFGIIDLGTNSIRAFVFEAQSRQSNELIFTEKVMVRLGDNVFEAGLLDPPAVARTIRAMKQFRKAFRRLKVEQSRAVATSAMRVAKNPDTLLETFSGLFGIPLEVISPEEECRLIAQGVTKNLELPDKPLVLIDMGGGSTEISLCHGKKVLESASMPFGAARGQQLFLKTVPPEKKGNSEEALRGQVEDLLVEAFPKLPFSSAKLGVGSSGSIRAFGKIYESNTAHRQVFTRSFLRDAVVDLRSFDRNELLRVPGLEEKRVDLILSAGIILHQIVRHFDIRKIQVTKFALKDGIYWEMAKEAFA